ncbi:MAG: hypothetical protein K2H47_09195 [Muribaculaceae bacterium]|nr:hypothetical protein [Muribaculaceae bacterium]
MLLIFNPDTDYALASGSPFFTPPARVIELRRSMALFPLTYALPGDYLLLLDAENIDFYSDNAGFSLNEVTAKGVTPVTLSDVADSLRSMPRPFILPWGWNPSLCRLLVEAGVDASLLPDSNQLSDLRRLSHRRLTISFNKAMQYCIPTLDFELPSEITSEEDAVRYWYSHSGCYFKSPWSSSGRGIMATADLEERHIRPWVRGMIRRQGSIMAEPGVKRSLDFASEWVCKSGHAHFVGLSVFVTSSRGKYKYNLTESQPRLHALISQACPTFGSSIIEAQRHTLNQLVAPSYTGPLGIDMLTSTDGQLRPCVELNLRLTMGMATLPSFRALL